MENKRLYMNDAYITHFDSKIVRTTPYTEGHFSVVLDRTAFYPESGGQPKDSGTINGVPVVDIVEDNGEILHILETALTSESAACEIDWKTRFEHMQQHSGQHILSACFAILLEGYTDSFHIGAESSTIEINIPGIDDDTAAKIEDMANHYVFANLPVKSYIVNSDELKKLPLRKQPKVIENIRIVQTGDFDFSP